MHRTGSSIAFSAFIVARSGYLAVHYWGVICVLLLVSLSARVIQHRC